MTSSAAPPLGSRRWALSAVLLAVFTVSAGYGLLLPQVPRLVRAAPGGHLDDVAFHAGLLTGLYMLAVAVFAPAWGRLSDRFGRRPVLLAGLIGFGLGTLVFASARTLGQLYLERVLSGLFAAAIAPVAAAYVADLAPTDRWRASRLAWVNMAAIAGFVLGPMLSAAAGVGGASSPLAAPLIVTGALALAAAALLARVMTAPGASAEIAQPARPASAGLVGVLLGLSFVVAFTVGVFEVGLAARAARIVQASAAELAVMFSVCSLVMFSAQAAVFSPWVRTERTRRVIAPGFVLIAVALVLAPRISGFAPAVAVVGLLAASAGATSPVVAYWLSMVAGQRQGSGLGDQAALASLGQALGSAAGGLLLGSKVADPFLIGAGAALTAALASALAAPRLSERGEIAAPAKARSKAPARP